MAFSSDDEFWNGFEASPALKQMGKYKMTDFFVVAPQFSLSIKSIKYEKVFSNMRLAREVELERQRKIVRKEVLEEIKANVEQVKNKYEQEVNFIVQQNRQLKNECLSLRKTLEVSTETIKIQEYLLTSCRLSEKPTKPLETQPDTNLEDLRALKKQLQLLKDVCRLYIDQVELGKSKVAGLEKDIYELNQAHCVDIKNLEEKRELIEKALKREIQENSQKFEDFKEEVKQEMELNTVINSKLVETINKLKDELKNAQIILGTPRLKQRTMERFKSVGLGKIGSERSTNRISLISLPSISVEKDGFSTQFETPKNSTRLIEFPVSIKKV